MGLRVPRSLKQRYPEEVKDKLQPYKKIFFICEGEVTEKKYLLQLQSYKKELGIRDSIDIIPLDKYGEHKGYSNPRQLFKLADQFKEDVFHEDKCDELYKYDKAIDKIVVMFDCDWEHYGTEQFEKERMEKVEIIHDFKDKYEIIITNPCIEIWLLMHKSSSIIAEDQTYTDVLEFIRQNEGKILKNESKSSNHRYLSSLVTENFHFNCKKRISSTLCLDGYEQAINIENRILEEKDIDDKYKLLNHVSSNFGYTLTKLLNIK